MRRNPNAKTDKYEEAMNEIKELDKEADELISEGKIEDVIFYFDKLDDQEKQECVLKLKSRLNGDA